MQVWDTAGQERFRTITQTYYKGASAILLVYDTTDRMTFESITHWMKQIETYAHKDVLKVLIANKIDKKGAEISYEEGEELAKKFNIQFFETSAKTGEKVDEVFQFCAERLVKKKELNPASQVQIKGGEVVKEDEYNKKKKFRWCKWLTS